MGSKNTNPLATLVVLVVVALIGLGGGFLLFSNSNDINEASKEETHDADGHTHSDEKLVSDYLSSYTIDDTGFGTMVSVIVDEEAGTRTIQRNALPNHETGEFPNSGNPNAISEQDLNETFPLNPVFVGEAQFANLVGVAINGVKLAPDTAERVSCETGQVYPIEAIQEVTNLGLDFNNAHVQPTGEYHYHGASGALVDAFDTDGDLVHVAFAADGFKIYYSKSGTYSPSYAVGTDAREGANCTYTPGGGGGTITFGPTKDGSLKTDWEFDASIGDLDECNGIEVNGEYIYLMTDEYPYIGRCLNGEVEASGDQSGPPASGQGPQGGPQGGPPQR